MKNGSSPRFCLPIPQRKHRCSESLHFERDKAEESREECRNREAMEAFVAKVFATVSAFKAAYAEQQMAQLSYNEEAIQRADQAVVDELKALSGFKQRYLKKQIGSSPPHVTLMLAEIQEQESLMKTYEVCVKQMQGEIENKESQISSLRQQLKEIIHGNKSLEKMSNASGPFSILDNVKFSDVNPQDFVLVLRYALRSVRRFVGVLIREMVSASWDTEAAALAIQPDVVVSDGDSETFAFESFVSREIFSGFNYPNFSIHSVDRSLPGENRQRRNFFFEQFKKLRSVSNPIQFVKQNPNSSLGKFLKSKYLHLVHSKMEFSFFGNLSQRKMVSSGEFPETEFFKSFAEMGRRVWLLHCIAFSFDDEVGIFQVKRNSRFSEVYMESVTEEIFAGDSRVAFAVVPGFRFSQTVVQSRVYLTTADS